MIFDYGFVQKLLHIWDTDDNDVRKEAMWALNNSALSGTLV